MTTPPSTPRVSVLLPVHNGGELLSQAIDSILAQTFTDFELVVVDDGSTDATAALLDGIDDPRVRVVHQANLGLPRALNNGLTLCRGEYVARQDHDDISLPMRLARQLAYMDAHPRCGVLGTRAEIHVSGRATGRALDHPLGDRALRFALLFDNPFVHSSVLIRKAALEAHGGYTTDPARYPPEDYELWSRLARTHQLANLPERLVQYHEVPGSLSRALHEATLRRVITLSVENLAACLGDAAPASALSELTALVHLGGALLPRKPDLGRALRLMDLARRCIDPKLADSELADLVARQRRLLRRAYLIHRAPRAVRVAARSARRRLSALVALARRQVPRPQSY